MGNAMVRRKYIVNQVQVRRRGQAVSVRVQVCRWGGELAAGAGWLLHTGATMAGW